MGVTGSVGRGSLNSTLKSLVFWIVLVVIGVVVWKLSSELQKPIIRRIGAQL